MRGNGASGRADPAALIDPANPPHSSRPVTASFWERRLVGALIVAIALLLLTARAVKFNFLSDDAFITYRYVQNLLAGNGLVFNRGERVEGFSNPLFLMLLAGLSGLGADLVQAGRVLGLLAALTTVALTGILTARQARRHGWLWGGLASAALALNPYLAIWALSGLETTLYSLLLLATVFPLLADRPRPRGFVVAALLAAAAALTRPEGVVFFPLLVVVYHLRRSIPPRASWSELLPGMIAWGVVIAGFECWRLFYYGEWLPNTFYAKSGFTANHVARGLGYLFDFSKNVWVLPAVILAAGGAALSGKAGRTLAAIAGLQIAIVVALGGDGLPAYRFAVPLLAPLFAAAAWGAEALIGVSPPRHRRATTVIVGFVAALLVGTAWLARKDTQLWHYSEHLREVPLWSEVGRWLAREATPGTRVALVPIGAVGYYSKLPVLDMMGLTDRHIARTSRTTMGSGWAGHEKSDGAYILDRAPDLILLGNVLIFPTPLTDARYFSPPWTVPDVYKRERDLIEDPRFTNLYRPTAFKIRNGMYLSCFTRVRP